MLKELTVDQVNTELRRLITENPDFVYTPKPKLGGCNYLTGPSYEPNRCNGCIFGQALQNLGVPKSDLKINRTITSLWVYWFSYEPPEFWRKIQCRQDAGHPWGNLLEFLPVNENE